MDFKQTIIELFMDFKQTIIELGNIAKAATFKSFLHLSYENTHYFFVTVLFNIFMRQTLTDDFWEIHKNMNGAFTLKTVERRL